MEETGVNREFKTFRVKELHPTFGAEIEGVNFPNPSDEQFQEILAAMAKVRGFLETPPFFRHDHHGLVQWR